MLYSRYRKQKGLSFVEVLIGMVIGTIILGGMLTVYMSGRKSYGEGDQLAIMDENARTAINNLKRHLEHAGYTSVTGKILSDYVLPSNMTNIVGGSVATNQNVKMSQDYTKGDTVGIRFKADSRLYTDCADNSIDVTKRICTNLIAVDEPCAKTPLSDNDSLIYNSFGINTNTEKDITGKAIPILYCYSSLGNGQAITQGIENMQVLYGIDMNADKVADRYINATTVAAEGLWGKILSLQVALLVRSRDPFYDKPQSETFTLLDQTITIPADRYRRAVYKTVIRLRNLEG